MKIKKKKIEKIKKEYKQRIKKREWDTHLLKEQLSNYSPVYGDQEIIKQRIAKNDAILYYLRLFIRSLDELEE